MEGNRGLNRGQGKEDSITNTYKTMSKDHAIQVFSHPQFGSINTVETENGKVLFKANDVAKALGYNHPADAVRMHCKGVDVLSTPYENQLGTIVMHPTKYISEADVYRLVMRSKLPEAEKFQDWVCEEVLPSIRKHGGYLTDAALQRVVTEPDFLIGLANAIKEERKNRLEVEAKCEEQKLLIGRQQERIEELGKRTSYVELVLQCKGLLDITQIAQDYGMSGRKMNAVLHEKGIQYKDNKQWILYAAYKDKGYVHSATLSLENGKSVMRTQWTQKGRMFIYEKLKADGILPVMEREQSPMNNQVTA